MTTPTEPTTPEATPTHWQLPTSNSTDYQILPRLRARLVALVAALVVQATIALLGVLPRLPVAPGVPALPDGYYVDYAQPVGFWAQFAAIEFIAAIVVSLAFGPGVRLSDAPPIARLVLGLGFAVLPAAALVLGGIDAAQAASRIGSAATASSWLSSATFGTLFFGLPLIALATPGGRAPTKSAAR